MKRRQLKKNSKNARCQYIADKICTIQRGIWVKYFQQYPQDLPNVLRFLRKSEKDFSHQSSKCVSSLLKRDVRVNYCNPYFNSESCDHIIWQLRNCSFLDYFSFKRKQDLKFKLACFNYNLVLNPPKDFKS